MPWQSLCWWVFLFSSLTTSAQELRIDSIVFSGLRKTRPEYLAGFVKSRPGEVLDHDQLRRDRQQLANLEVLADAQYRVENRSGGGALVIFECRELFTLLPIVNFGGIAENLWFQVGGSEANLFGRGHKFYAFYQYYDRHSFAANLSLDRLGGSPWGVEFNFVKWGTREPLFFDEGVVEYNYDNFTYGINGIYHFNLRDKLLLGGAYFTEIYEAATPIVSGAPTRAQTYKWLIKILYQLNRTDYDFFYRSGWLNTFNAQTVRNLNNDPAFYIFFNDLHYYRRVGPRGNAASRVRIGLSSNEDSPFAPFVLDSYVNIRGVGNRVDRGTGVIVGNFEYRHAFIDRPVIAVQGVAFADLGVWRNPGGNFSDFTESENIVMFGGVGLRFIHKNIYNAIFRIDYGVDLQKFGDHGFVLGIGQYF